MEDDLNLIDFHHLNGNKIDMSYFGLTGLKLVIPSPSYRTVTEEIEGRAGIIVLERTLSTRNLIGEFFSQAKTYDESLSIRDGIFNLLGNGQAFYVSENKNPLRRWRVFLEDWTPERMTREVHKFEIPLAATSGTSETINVIKKAFTTNTFRYKNEGSVTIDPRMHSETEITFKGASSKLRIVNKTTGEEWSWTGDTLSDDVIKLKGVRALKNDVSIYRESNKKLITIISGWNEFEVIGTTGDFELIIRSRFYFL